MSKTNLKIVDELREEVGDDFFKIKIKLGDKVFKANLLEDLISFDTEEPLLLQRELIKQPGQFAKYGMILNEAKKRLSDVKRQYKKWLRQKRREVTKILVINHKKEKIRSRPTKDDIEAEIEYRFEEENDSFEMKIDKWEHICNVLDVAVKAFEQRKGTLTKQADMFNVLINQGALVIKKRFSQKEEE